MNWSVTSGETLWGLNIKWPKKDKSKFTVSVHPLILKTQQIQKQNEDNDRKTMQKINKVLSTDSPRGQDKAWLPGHCGYWSCKSNLLSGEKDWIYLQFIINFDSQLKTSARKQVNLLFLFAVYKSTERCKFSFSYLSGHFSPPLSLSWRWDPPHWVIFECGLIIAS